MCAVVYPRKIREILTLSTSEGGLFKHIVFPDVIG